MANRCSTNWGASSGATSYDLRANNSTIVYTGGQTTVMLTTSCATSYTVRACNTSGCSAYSAPAYPSNPQ